MHVCDYVSGHLSVSWVGTCVDVCYCSRWSHEATVTYAQKNSINIFSKN